MIAKTNKSKFLILLSIAISIMMPSSDKTLSKNVATPT